MPLEMLRDRLKKLKKGSFNTPSNKFDEKNKLVKTNQRVITEERLDEIFQDVLNEKEI